MSDIERPAASRAARPPSTFSKAPGASTTKPVKSHRKDGTPRPRLLLNRRRDPRQDLGGARRDRTDDLMLAKHALSQLSYGPVQDPPAPKVVVGLGGLEPPTSRLSSARSNQLSYKPGRKKKSRAARAFSSRARRTPSHILKSERETKAARSRQMRPDWAA
jgi:hypothetical protein